MWLCEVETVSLFLFFRASLATTSEIVHKALPPLRNVTLRNYGEQKARGLRNA